MQLNSLNMPGVILMAVGAIVALSAKKIVPKNPRAAAMVGLFMAIAGAAIAIGVAA